MRRKPLFWFLLSLLCIGGALCFWGIRSQRQNQKNAVLASAIQPAGKGKSSGAVPSIAKPANPLATNPANAVSATNAAALKSRYPYRLSNTDEKLSKLVHNDKAILLANALIDTSKSLNLAIPDRLRAPANNGTYVVQSSGVLNDQFRALLQNANATIVSYIPNNAYLVRVSETGAQQIAADAQTQSVLPYEPYYKLDNSLLKMAMENPDSLPLGGRLNLTLFTDAYQSTLGELQQLGAQVTQQDHSPFGPLVTVQATAGTLAEIATLPGVQAVAAVHARVHANDLDRPRLNVSADSIVPTNYLGLTGTNVLLNINDSGVDAQHPDLVGRIFSLFTNVTLIDTNGHGTHVAGTIMGSGVESTTVPTNPPGSVVGANFRGMAPDATALFLPIFEDPNDLISVPDGFLQEAAALTNALISNNSWNYSGDFDYDIAAASYDAAVRDALPFTPGSQPLLFVFSAGNEGQGYSDGTGGSQDSILSPATAKNVITVGAIEEPRYITNIVIVDGQTNNEMYTATDNEDAVASFSSRGNVGIQVEGNFGRFKPDLVAPGTFVISCRSEQWNSNIYYSPTNETFFNYTNNVIGSNGSIDSFVFPVPQGAVAIIITLETNLLTGATNLPPMPIYMADNAFPVDNGTDQVGTNMATVPNSIITTLNPGDTIYFDVGNSSSNTVHFDVDIELLSTNDNGDYYLVLSNLNNQLGPWYRYESGTSMAAAGVSGMLALMQQFFEQKLQLTNSPALMKALLINGARSLSDQYDFAVNNPNLPTSQGWGLPSLPNSIPPALNNLTSGNLASMPLQFYDQNPTNALATGQSMVYNLALNGDASLQDLRVTLVWTDPPGNPQAGVKLVNDLNLIVSNTITGESYFGNDIPVGSVYNEVWDTNNPPNIDSVNNVENVFIQGPSGTNFTITVLGNRVNVNAVTANTNNIVQDYALVVSSGDAGTTSGAFTLTPANGGLLVSNNVVTNVLVLSNNVPVLNQRVGANSQFSGSTNGNSNQWNFYIYTNTAALTNSAFTNVAFVTFQPPNLGLPRMGAFDEIAPPDPDATRYAGADIDLYVSTDPTLTNLNPAAVNAASRSVGPIGNEVVYFTNSTPGEVYYVGVKSEDQQAAQFDLIGFATDVPFSQTGTNGNTVVAMNPIPLPLPVGAPTQPKSTLMIGICTAPIQIRKVVVTNTVTCQDFGDYIGSLSEGQQAAVLNNHSLFTNANDMTETLVYDDSGESEFPGALTSAGPGSLRNFVGINAAGTAWTYTVVNDSSLTDSGTIDYMSLLLEKQYPPNSGYHKIPPLLPGAWYYGFVDVPPNATNLTVSVSGNTGIIDLLIQEGSDPTFSNFEKSTNFPAPGGSLSISKYDTPPLNAGMYFYGIHAHNAEANLSVETVLQYSFNPEGASVFYGGNNVPLADDAVTYSTNLVNVDNTIVSAEVGVRINHPRESDLVLTLISPQGTRVLLAENRGALDTNGYGSGTNYTIASPPQNSGNASTSTNVIQVGVNTGILNVSYNFFQEPDEMAVFYDGNKIWDTGFISYTGQFSVPFGPGNSTNVVIVMNPYGNPATNGDEWNYTATVTAQNVSYATFTANTNITQLPIKFAVPPFGAGPANLPAMTNVSSGFEAIPATSYGLGAVIPYTNGSWTVVATNQSITTVPEVVTVPALTLLGGDGSNVLALHGGTISTTLPTIPGFKYSISFAYHGRPALTPVSWWKGENNTSDSADGNNLYNVSTNTNSIVNYAPGVVGQAFALDGNEQLLAPDAANLYLTNAITVEGWVESSNLHSGIILQRGSSNGYNPYTLSVEMDGGITNLQWEIMDTNGDSVLLTSPMPPTGFTHVASTYAWGVGTNTNAVMTIYVNGLPMVTTNTSIVPPGAINPSFQPGLGVGTGGNVANGGDFDGLLDEIALYNFGFSDAQVQDVYAAGSAGKDPVDETPPVTAEVILGAQTNEISGMDAWQSQVYTFTATTNNMSLTFVPNQDGMLLDAVQLVQDVQPNPANYYLPEESLAKLVGEDCLGTWQLEVLDNRAGATNPPPTLVSWRLSLTLTDKVPYSIPVEEGLTETNIVAPGSITYFEVNVPVWAKFATNILTSSSSVNLLFNQTASPTGTNVGDVFLLNNVTITQSSVLQTAGNPPLLPGETYYLGVQNNGAAPATFTLQVDFDITPLFNMIPIRNQTIYVGVPRYFVYDVGTNAVSTLFQILNPSGNVELVASKGLPLPDTSTYDYISEEPGASPQNIIVITNSTPVPLGPGNWYLGVFNNDVGPVSYTIKATEVDQPLPEIITLTNGVPFKFKAVPGPDLRTFFLFNIATNYPAALFELYNQTGNVDLTLQEGALPYEPPYFAESSNGTNREQIVIRTNVLGTNIIGNWYLGVPNNTANNVTYTIRAVVSTNGLLISEAPLQVTATVPPSEANSGPTLSWQGVVGEWYEVQDSSDLINWTTIAIIVGDGDTVSYTDPTPILGSPLRFYRVIQIPPQ